jgi:hypothetical protein
LPSFVDFGKLCSVTKAIYILGATSGVAAISAPVDWLSSASRVGQYVFDAYFIAFIDAANFGTLCF